MSASVTRICALHCDAEGCTATFAGTPDESAKEVRERAYQEGWIYPGTRDERCPAHAQQELYGSQNPYAGIRHATWRERWAEVCALVENGATFGEVGRLFGVSAERARQLYGRALETRQRAQHDGNAATDRFCVALERRAQVVAELRARGQSWEEISADVQQKFMMLRQAREEAENRYAEQRAQERRSQERQQRIQEEWEQQVAEAQRTVHPLQIAVAVYRAARSRGDTEVMRSAADSITRALRDIYTGGTYTFVELQEDHPHGPTILATDGEKLCACLAP